MHNAAVHNRVAGTMQALADIKRFYELGVLSALDGAKIASFSLQLQFVTNLARILLDIGLLARNQSTFSNVNTTHVHAKHRRR